MNLAEILKPTKRGKVRDIFDFGDKLLIVATDRISAYDCVLPNEIPLKGKILTQLSVYWFERTHHIVENHLISTDISRFPPPLAGHADYLEGRSMLVKRTEVIPVECVVRGYLSGSGWREYGETGSICGIPLPEGLRESEKLPFPIFTSTTKATSGHDESISFERMTELIGEERAEELKRVSLELYKFAVREAESKGIIIADTKFEFGRWRGKTILIDEIFTPDSSRFWAVADYSPGGPQGSFDKQFVRDWLDSTGWNHEPPPPSLPKSVIKQTTRRYIEAYERITGRKFADS
ncbi:MAG: phosphoribosylaminoimidazolesuccinocarboxamide synthase [Actinomycetota bacterium]|nr:phosphoribosylaminoimidazolesuccinocarboxamide synthase [Actinomycetota bacterium]